MANEEGGTTWVCQDCPYEWIEENPFITPGDCPDCGSEYIQHN